MVRTVGSGLVASPEQVHRIRTLIGQPVSPEHMLWWKARGRRTPNRGVYSHNMLAEIENVSPQVVLNIVHRTGAYVEEDRHLGYFERLNRWVARG